MEGVFSPRPPPKFALRALAALSTSLAVAVAACDRKAPEPLPVSAERSATPQLATSVPPPAATPSATPLSARLSRPAAEHVVAIGDLHGDIDVTRRALRLSGAIDGADHWVGGALVVVQTGDEIDRGDSDRKVLDLIESLREPAKKAGGEIIALSGNHEIMNVAQDFRYVSPAGFAAFDDLAASAQGPGSSPDRARGRAAAFAPGGRYAKMLAERPIVAKVGDTVFVHGGILPKHVAYGLDRMTDEVSDWMLGKRSEPPAIVVAEDGPVWTRAYSSTTGADACALASRALDALGAKRMVVGHTPQTSGVTSACGDKVWRIDVGMSHFYGGPVQVLEIDRDAVKVRKQAAQ
jgi:hypothetical protein